jgi:hypothetical protein
MEEETEDNLQECYKQLFENTNNQKQITRIQQLQQTTTKLEERFQPTQLYDDSFRLEPGTKLIPEQLEQQLQSLQLHENQIVEQIEVLHLQVSFDYLSASLPYGFLGKKTL